MINISELRGTSLKRDLGLRRVVKRWHNHNNTGGNFGINLMTATPPNYEVTGYHDLQGNISTLRVGELFQPGTTIFNRDTMARWTYDKLISLLKKYISKPEGPGWTENLYSVESMKERTDRM